MSAQQRGRRSVRTATAVLAGTGLAVAATVGGIAAAQDHPITERTARQSTVPGGTGQAGQEAPDVQDQHGSADGQGQQSPWSPQGGDQSQGRQAPGFDPWQDTTDQQDPGRQSWGGQDMQGQGVSPGQGPAMGQSHGS